MKKIIFLFFTAILFVNCKPLYSSYIYDIDLKKPIKNVKIYDIDSLVAKTDSNGYFELKRIKGRELTFKKKNYRITTIRTISTQNGEFVEKSFIGDTIFLIHKESKYNRYFDNK